MPEAAYIHIPFCEHICHYCDFNKVFLKGQPVDEYIELLDREMEMTAGEHLGDKLKTIFVGGGTPTALSEAQLEKLCLSIRERLPFEAGAEYTFEANPGDLSLEKLKILKDTGVNRLSFGVQTFNDELLQRIGRSHRKADVFTSVEAAQKVGFENISIDLIYSLPGQTLEDFSESLNTAFTLGVTHYSGYSLIIEPKTVFYNLMKKGKLPLPGEQTEADMYSILMDKMEEHGFQQYEISNFSLPGFESRHNLTYWNNEEYYGFGAGSHGYLNGKRESNYGPLKKYMEPIKSGQRPVMDTHTVPLNERIEEEMFLGLRKTSGVSIQQFKRKFARDPLEYLAPEIEEHKRGGLLEVSGDFIHLTRQGKFLGNEVFQSFIGVSNR